MPTDSDRFRAERSDPSLELPIELATTGEFVIPPTFEEEPIGRIGRYDVMGRMAVGGMAEIYLARETATVGVSRFLVVKVIRPQLAGRGDFGEMFLNEGRVALRLKHPNICHVYEVGVDGGQYFIAMEYVHGVTLREVLQRAIARGQRLPVPVVVRIVAHVAEALSSAHKTLDEQGRGVVHRDVTPQNVMVGFDGVVKLLDFGIAEAQGDRRDAESGTFKGKVSYLAPEQCKGAAVDGRSDIFSLGVTFWEALTGRSLFKRSNDVETMLAIARDPVPHPGDYGAPVPEPVVDVLGKALRKDPADRYQTAGEMSRALQQYLVDSGKLIDTGRIARSLERLFADEMRRGPVLDRSEQIAAQLPRTAPTEPPPAEPAPRRNRRAIAGVAAGVLLVAAAGVAWAVSRPDGSGEPSTPAPTVAAPSSADVPDDAVEDPSAAPPEKQAAASTGSPDAGAAKRDEEEHPRHKRLRTKRGFLVDPDF